MVAKRHKSHDSSPELELKTEKTEDAVQDVEVECVPNKSEAVTATDAPATAAAAPDLRGPRESKDPLQLFPDGHGQAAHESHETHEPHVYASPMSPPLPAIPMNLSGWCAEVPRMPVAETSPNASAVSG